MTGLRFVMAGVLVAGLVVVVGAQPGGGFGGFNFGPAQLVMAKAVQEDLKMTDEQVEKVKTWSKEFNDKVGEDRKAKFADFKDKTKEEQAEMRAAFTAETNKAAFKALDGVLKPEQVKRLKQIQVQASGMNAYTNPDVVAALKLTDSQKSTIKGVSADYDKDRAEVMKGIGGGKGKQPDPEKFADALKKGDKLRKEAMAKVEETLTDDQKKAWKELTGEAFDTTKLVPTFGKGKN